jgi:UBX domain-containing protein 1
MPEGWGRPAASAAPARSGAGGFSAGGGRGGIATFRDLAAAQGSGSGGPSGPAGDDSDDESDDGRDPANFYAGGERSGLNVVNPNRGARGPQPDVVADILRQAQEAGARGPDPEEEGTLSRTGGTGPSFSGRGRTIGQEAEEEDELAGAEEEEAPVTEETVIRHLTFWQDGFSVEDGPLMRYDDPAHAQTLAQINNGRAPLALLGVRFGQPVELRVARRTDEKYTPPPPAPMKPFGGSGQRLGSPAPTPSSSAQPAAAPATRAPNPTNVAFEIDDAQPTTTLQIRLIDGQRVSARFNTSHTVADIRRWIDA